MTSTDPRGTALVRAQALVALGLPWLLVALGAGLPSIIAAAFVVGSVVFAFVQDSLRGRWAIPVSVAATLASPLLPPGATRSAWMLGAAALALAVAVVAATRARASTSRYAPARLVAVVGLAGLALVLGSTAAYSTVAEDRRYADAQALASTQWTSMTGLRDKQAEDAALAQLEFHRPGGRSPIAGGIYVFSGTTDAALAKGPGWYRTTSRPGNSGNTAIAGHRTGHGSPFADLDQVRVGDEVTVRTPGGDVRTYRVADILTVAPDENWVLGPDPRGDGSSLLTLTTCDPPGVNSERLIVQAVLVDGSSPA